MKLYVNETDIEEVKKGPEVAIIKYSTPTQTPNCGSGTGNYGKGWHKKESYITFEMYDLIEKNGIKKVPTCFLDRLVWDKKGALDILQDYAILYEAFNRNKKRKNL
jgi:hypothetical protein